MKNQHNPHEIYEAQEKKLSQQSSAFLELLTKRGLLADQEIHDENVRKAKKEKTRNMYHNTLLLLRHYRDIVWVVESFPSEVAQELEVPMEGVDQLLDLVDTELGMNNRKMENRLLSLQKTRLLLDRLNEAVSVIRKKPVDGERMYNVLYYTYITPDRLTHLEIIEKLDMSTRNYYRIRQQAINLLSIRLWSAPSGDLDTWLEVLSLLQVL